MLKKNKRRKRRSRSKNKKGPSFLKIWAKRLGVVLLVLFVVFALLALIFRWIIKINEPTPEDTAVLELERKEVAENFYRIENNWLKKNNSGLWEMYIEGEAFERGVINGKLSVELVEKQEIAFVNQIKELVPSDFYLRFLKYGIGWFNRDLDEYIPEEYQLEILGVSKAASDEYQFIAPNYQRILNYHAAHDIGHALQNMNMVGCTSFAAWDRKSADSTLIIGRNFDFYVGDEFAEDKIVSFVNPDEGHQFMMITWGGMIGSVSGMNVKGLTMTMNAAKSEIPAKAATPISIVGRQILQYASNIEEAYAIAKQSETFVSESLMIGSAEDNRTAIIEITPTKKGIYRTTRNYAICSNHFQSDELKAEELNKQSIAETDTDYRYKRMKELITQEKQIDQHSAARILRNQRGLEGADIGMGNEKAINQLIAHHAIIFKPASLQVWVSAPPWQLGEFVAYDLGKIFSDTLNVFSKEEIKEDSLTIPVDNFLFSSDYQKFKLFRASKKQLLASIKSETEIEEMEVFAKDFVATNPNFYLTYVLLGNYFKQNGNCDAAVSYYTTALEKEIPKIAEITVIQEQIKECTEDK